LGPASPSDVVVDSSGNVWVSEPVTNKIVRLSPSTPDYALSPTSSYVSLTQGSSIPIAIAATSVSGYAGHLTFTALGLPHGITISANPLYLPAGGNASSILEINVASGVPPGTDSMTIEGSDGTTDHTIGLILSVMNSSTTSTGQQLETRCFVAIPIYLPQSTLLVSLLIDVFIGAFYIGLPPEYFSQRFRLVKGLSRRSWLIALLLAPSLLCVASAVLLIC